MKRTILSLTTAIALAMPAYAQDNFDSVIADALQSYGYAAENIDALTDAERAEIYTTATSGDAMDVRTALAGMDLTEMDMPEDLATVEITPDTELRVAEVLTTNGYPEGTVDMLTQAEIANIYVTATSGDAGDVERVLDGLQLGDDAEMTSVTPDSTERVIEYLQDNGYSQAEIAAVSEGEMADIYVAITSGNESDIQDAIEGAINS